MIESPVNEQTETILMPKLVVEKASYDFGDIKPGSTNTAVFNFANTGDGPLMVTDIKRCCGAVAKVDKEELAPGESGVLTAKYRVGKRTGAFRKKINLVTNDPGSQQTELIITGNVIQTLKWTPTRFEISPYKNKVECPEIKITSLNDTPFTIKGFNATGQCFTADFDPTYEATEFTIKPRVDAAKLEAVSVLKMRGNIKIKLGHEDYDSIDLNFKVIPSLQAIPAQILAFNAKVNKPILKSFRLLDDKAAPNESISERIESVTSRNGVKVDVLRFTDAQDGCKFDLKISPSNNDEKPKSVYSDELVIRMGDGRELNVPVRIFYESGIVSSKAD
ncbi:MAG: DUF1573 domain-containing protein [Phycisphaerales bacterium]